MTAPKSCERMSTGSTFAMSHKREGRMVSRSVAVILLVLVHCRSARAETYRVGPVENHQSVSALVDFLQPGDTVEITGDIVDTFVLSSQGTQTHPVTIKGAVTAQNLRVTRPRITIPRGAEHGLVFRGGCAVLEGLEITGALGDNFQSGSALWHACDNLVIRNCYIHHNRQGIFGDSYSSGSTLIEFSEFDSNGGLPQKVTMMHSVYLNSTREGARYCQALCVKTVLEFTGYPLAAMPLIAAKIIRSMLRSDL